MKDEPHQKEEKVLFTCSGCSDAGFLAHQLGLSLHHEGYAEMSCLAGLSAGKQKFLGKIKGKKVILIDGCITACGKEIFKQRKLKVDHYISLDDHGISKKEAVAKQFDCDHLRGLVKKIKNQLEINKTIFSSLFKSVNHEQD